MRCKTCDYRLWNIRGRQCPECGTDFRPSEFEFKPNAVEFCCPHCDTAYYGTTHVGHLSPIAFDCVTCGKHVHMDDMILRAAPGQDDNQTQRDMNPWFERNRRGWFKAWMATIGWGLTQPGRLMKATPADSTGSSWRYGMGNLVICVIASFALCAPLMVFSVISAPPPGTGRGPSPVLIMLTAMGAGVLGYIILGLILYTFWGAVAHGLLRLFKASPAHPIGRTYQALGFTAGTLMLMAVPCIGQYAAIIWWVVSATIALKEAQRITGGKAALAAVTPPVLFVGSFVGVYIGFIIFALSTAPGGGPAGMAAPGGTNNTLQLTTSIVQYANDNDGYGPPHAGQLILEDIANDLNFTEMYGTPGTNTDTAAVLIGGTDLESFAGMLMADQRAILEGSASLPDNVVAHRLGDFVFTYHGIDLNTADGTLWIVIYSPDPAQNATGTAANVAVGRVDGTVITIPQYRFLADLAVENASRADDGLPPLPDPATVKHGQPALP